MEGARPAIAPPAGWPARQATLRTETSVTGCGLHTGRKTRVTLSPRAPDGNVGVVFRRGRDGVFQETRACLSNRVRQYLHTALRFPDGTLARTVEHLLAALLAAQMDCVTITLEGGELPILDGGASAWLARLREAGRTELDAPKSFLRVRRPFAMEFTRGGRLEAVPADGYEIIMETEPIRGYGRSRWSGRITEATFAAELAPARSYGPVLWAIPAIAGGVIGRIPVLRGVRPGCVAAVLGGRVLGGMRLPEEFARHRALDMVGDFALAGAPLLGRVTGRATTHDRNFRFMAALTASPDAVERVVVDGGGGRP